MRAVYEDREAEERQASELTLGMGSLLGIFFGVVLVCGVFFGFGYSMGRHNPSAPSPASTETAEAGSSPHPAKPSAITSRPEQPQFQSPLPGSYPKTVAPKNVPEEQAASGSPSNPNFPDNFSPPVPDEGTDARSSRAARSAQESVARSEDLPVAHSPENAEASAPRRSALPKPHAGTAAAPGETTTAEVRTPTAVSHFALPPPTRAPMMVQIAAVTRQEDADVLAAALRRHGFSPMIRSGLADKFFHVQIGPFTDKSQAELVKERLIADGYNAIVK